jgi:Flp pilus assembly pilin Flp
MKIQKQNRNQKRGAALVEYGLIIAGVALVAVAAISIFGHKTGGIIASTARVLPGAQAEDNKMVSVGQVVATTTNADGSLTVDTTTLDDSTVQSNLGLGNEELVDDPNDN